MYGKIGETEAAKLYISGGTITNTAEEGYAVYCEYESFREDEFYSELYLSGTPTISGPTADIATYKAISANDGEASPTAYTGGSSAGILPHDIGRYDHGGKQRHRK